MREHLLLTGPPDSGKSHRVLEAVRERLRRGGAIRLLAPTATMAEHLRNLLAREGFVFRAGLVSTLAKFIESQAEDLPPVSGALLDFSIRKALERAAAPGFAAVKGFEGFRAALARSIGELASSGCDAAQLGRVTAGGFQSVYAEVEKDLAARGALLSGERLRRVAARIREQGPAGPDEIFFDGFFRFTGPELDLIEALSRHARLTVTLPAWPGAETSRSRLLEIGCREERCPAAEAGPETVLVRARTREQELEEIAARLLEQASAGRPFREMGVIVRTADPYVPALRATLERFGIPARFYFAEPLADHSLARYVAAAIEAAPGWGADRQTPAEWAERVKSLGAQYPQPEIAEPATHAMAAIWRSAAVALGDFGKAVDETEAVFPKGARISFPDFRDELKVALHLAELRVPDHRRDVVHVMDVYEARQWKLPVVFVCGLLEKQFPLYHAQDPLLPDDVRTRLGARTTQEWEAEERFLFDLATTRASESMVLSYPRFDQKGEETLRSFYLDRFLEAARNVTEAPARSARPEPLGARPPVRRPLIYDEGLRQRLAKRFERISVTALESFLQCPFQFFAGQTLRLVDPPVEPEERLDLKVQGNVIHEVLGKWLYSRGAIEPLLEAVFVEACRREQIPSGYRTESVRLELLRNLRRFIPQALATGAQPEKAEQDVELQLEDKLTLRGRIDRIDASPDGRALIIDYKNSAPDKIKALVKAHLEGRRIQGGVYMLALRQAGREVAGMLFAGLRGKTAWDGWSTLNAKPSAPEELAAVMASAREAALGAVAKIREGVIEPKPADPRLCQYCSFYDACRFESAAKVGAGGEAEE